MVEHIASVANGVEHASVHAEALQAVTLEEVWLQKATHMMRKTGIKSITLVLAAVSQLGPQAQQYELLLLLSCAGCVPLPRC